MLPGDSETFQPKHAFDPLKFIVLNPGAHMNHRSKGFPTDEVLQSLRSSVAAIRAAGVDTAAHAIARKESPPAAVLEAIEKRALERTASSRNAPGRSMRFAPAFSFASRSGRHWLQSGRATHNRRSRRHSISLGRCLVS